MYLTLALAIALLESSGPIFPAGSFKPDLSQVPSSSRAAIAKYFEETYLVLGARGDLVFCGHDQHGFWRTQKDQVVIVFDGLGRDRSLTPTSILRRTTPTNPQEGFILRKGQDKTLTLDQWGQFDGPVVFRPIPKRSVTQLILLKDVFPPDPASLEATYALRRQKQREWPELIGFINDPKRTWEQRSTAAIFLTGITSNEGVEAAARLALNLRPTNEPRQEDSILTELARTVAAHPTEKAVDLLLEANAKGIMSPFMIAPAAGALNRKKDIPLLIKWLSTEEAFEKAEVLKALARMGAKEALEPARQLTNDPDEMVRAMAWGLIVRVSTDETERSTAVDRLGELAVSSNDLGGMFAMEALTAAKVPKAIPKLVEILDSNADSLLRRNLAIILGGMKNHDVIPVLRRAKAREKGPGGRVPEQQVNRAAADALDHLEKVKAGEHSIYRPGLVDHLF